jgi:ABC-type branched-subunit amino acid transport system ATPase component
MIRVDKVTKAFGANVAVDGVSLELRPGKIVGLIGPNGSGKTTLLNLVSGYYSVGNGTILIDTAEVTNLGASRRSRLGLARTFQKPRVIDSLSVIENAMLGGFASTGCGAFHAMLNLKIARREYDTLRRFVVHLLEACGLSHTVAWRAERLTHAEKRILEVVRALVAKPRYLLLDEPAGGLTWEEIGYLGEILSRCASSGIGLLIVEHHTEFVFNLCEEVIVLNFGKVICSGEAAAVRADPLVGKVYLGN